MQSPTRRPGAAGRAVPPEAPPGHERRATRPRAATSASSSYIGAAQENTSRSEKSASAASAGELQRVVARAGAASMASYSARPLLTMCSASVHIRSPPGNGSRRAVVSSKLRRRRWRNEIRSSSRARAARRSDRGRRADCTWHFANTKAAWSSSAGGSSHAVAETMSQKRSSASGVARSKSNAMQASRNAGFSGGMSMAGHRPERSSRGSHASSSRARGAPRPLPAARRRARDPATRRDG